MKNKLSFLIFSSVALMTASAYAGNFSDINLNEESSTIQMKDDNNGSTIRKSYITTGFEGNILSTATLEKNGVSDGLTTPRFTTFFHIGANYHYDFSNNAGIFTGLGIRNIGFIEKYTAVDSTVKRRIYGLTVPLVVKFGQDMRRNYFFAGAEGTMAIHYKEKGFVKRNDKVKKSEWFSKRTPLFHPSLTAGYYNTYFYVKFNYYLNNFLNTEYVDKGSVKSYEGYKVNLISMTFGINIPYKNKYKPVLTENPIILY